MSSKTARLKDVAQYVNDKIPVIDLTRFNYVSTENLISDFGGIVPSSGLPNGGKATGFQKEDILISNIRPYFKKIWYAVNNGGSSNDVLVLRANNNIVSKYLYYSLAQSAFFEYVMSGAKGTKMPRGDKTHILNFPLIIPSLIQQESIAHILSTLDYKIEVNNRINKTLEDMAQAIFKSWFVDFEFPNEDGEPYKSSGGEMVESELGMIPKGWRVGTFSHFVDSTLGGDWGKDSLQGNFVKEVFCIRGADLDPVMNGELGKAPKRFVVEKNYNKKKLEPGNLIIEISGGSPTQSTGRIAYISEELIKKFSEPIICTNFCRAIKLKRREYMEFVHSYWNTLYAEKIFFHYENGTTGIKNLNIQAFLERHQIMLPHDEILIRFSEIIRAFHKTVQSNGAQNTKLSEIRDALLPKLMAGEITVPIEES